VQAGFAKINAQVARARSKVKDARAGGQLKVADCTATPTSVEAESHDTVDKVIARRNGIKHVSHHARLVVALRKFGCIPAGTLGVVGGVHRSKAKRCWH
jgi:hypothetical protein